MPYEVSTETAKVYKVRFKKAEGEQHRFGWADAAVRSWPGGGSLSVQSDYGTYAYTWCATGPGPFTAFLLDLDFDYFMGKARPGYRVFDQEKSVLAIKEMILDHRRHRWGDLDKAKARACWDDLEHYGSDPTTSADYFLTEILSSHALSDLFDGDYGDLARTCASPETVGFWKEIWPVLCAHWQDELTPAASAAA